MKEIQKAIPVVGMIGVLSESLHVVRRAWL
jgi:hypothetical protein